MGYCIVAHDKWGQGQAEELVRWQAQLLDFVNDAIFIHDWIAIRSHTGMLERSGFMAGARGRRWGPTYTIS